MCDNIEISKYSITILHFIKDLNFHEMYAIASYFL